MKFALIICTYLRPTPLLKLLQSVDKQTVYPSQIVIVDGSTDNVTLNLNLENQFKNVCYFKVTVADRGLTKQRNFGIQKVAEAIEVVCFLDDDIILENNYFEELLKTYQVLPDALGVGGNIINESKWEFVGDNYKASLREFYFDGWKQNDGSRFILRKAMGLDSDCPPGYSSMYSHGRSVGFLPPSGKTYEVEMMMGGVSSFRKKVFESINFSTYFVGYGLYEDADFSLRVAKIGKLYLNTAAKLHHYHDGSGRPNQYTYGKMVVRNGWYVWRVKNPHPTIQHHFKWHAITILLTVVRFSNIFTSNKRIEAFTETLGRTVGWWVLWFNRPKRSL
ncbi:Glycosyltransferase, GT2 family [Flavobacterium gillisiae]|uniref:Glycosyltransferase, GT2 family n=1 Tax=Flavobacterium gillisiae TaxID=150146 RepID=A0A1H4EXQ6_9FLAO|nr:glycosyltransferase [Flavobacterium gillisiae]SEA89358.1 Glycosyltransferase, GT2 family [Flavobacterium gillisiae]